MKAWLLACAAAGLSYAFPVMAGAQVSGTMRSARHGPAPPPYAAVASARSLGFEPINDPMRRGSVYIIRAVNPQGMRVRIIADGRSGRILSLTRPHDGPAPARGRWRYSRAPVQVNLPTKCRTRSSRNLQRAPPARRWRNPSWFQLRRSSSNEKSSCFPLAARSPTALALPIGGGPIGAVTGAAGSHPRPRSALFFALFLP
jgi:hypothetical protein